MLFGMMMGAHGDRVSIAWLCPYTLITSIIDMRRPQCDRRRCRRSGMVCLLAIGEKQERASLCPLGGCSCVWGQSRFSSEGYTIKIIIEVGRVIRRTPMIPKLAGAVVGLLAFTARAVQHRQHGTRPLQHHLGGVAVVAGLVLPFAGAELALDIDLAALAQIPLGNACQPFRKYGYIVPLGALLLFPGVTVFPAFRCGNAMFATLPPFWKLLTSGSAPRLPTRMTLQTEPAIYTTFPEIRFSRLCRRM